MSALWGVLRQYAEQKRVELPPHIQDLADHAGDFDGPEGLERWTQEARWEPARRLTARPGPDAFPLLIYHPQAGWMLGEQWDNMEGIRVSMASGSTVIDWSPDLAIYALDLPDPVRRTEKLRAFDVFWGALMRRRKVLAVAILATIVANILTLATSLFSMQVYDRVIPRSSFSTLWVLSVGVLVALAIDFALRASRALMIERESAVMDGEISEFFFARMQATRLDTRPPGVGTMAANMRGIDTVRALLSSSSLFLLTDLPFALFFIAVIAMLSGKVALVPLAAFPISIGIALALARLIRKDTEKAQMNANLKNGLLVEALDAAETIKANRGSWHVLGRWNRLVEATHIAEDPVKRSSAIAGSVFSTIQQISYVLLIVVGALEVTQGHITTGALVAAAIIAGRVNGPLIAQLPNLIVQWQYARSSLKLLDSILALPLDQDAETQPLRPTALPSHMRMEAAQFAYPGQKETVSLPALDIPQGQRVAIIGGIGSGKTTMLRLLAGLYRPSQGRILLGGVDMALLADDVVRGKIGYLGQDNRLINGTLRDNLLLGLSHPGDDMLLKVGQQTTLTQLIGHNERGLDLPIFEGGRGLSGGQRTIAGLTRLLLADPDIWLLDEPTANLDQMTEQRILQLLAGKAREQKTLIMVTHRMNLLQIVDRVIVMAQGKIVMDGPRDQVLERLKRPAQPTTASSSSQAASPAQPASQHATPAALAGAQ